MHFLDTMPKLTSSHISYFQQPGIALLAQPQFSSVDALTTFLQGFDDELGFEHYLEDDTHIDDATALCKVAGQLCYMSFGPKRTMNEEASKYFDNIKSSGHGSVLEHANFSVLLWGVSRSFTHEMVRHRAGFGFSQVSQRYVSGKTLRFVERPEYQKSPRLHGWFENRIEVATQQYNLIAEELMADMADQLKDLPATERRKAVNQAARSCLPNETEAPIVITGNARSWRHFFEMRCARPAEPEARFAAQAVYELLVGCTEHLFSDYTLNHDDRGYPFLETKTRKV